MIKLEIGGWWAMCCIHDLDQIKTAEDLEAAGKYFNDPDPDEDYGARYWPTLEAALAALEEDGDFERGMAYALRRHFGLPMSAQSVVRRHGA